MDHFGTMIDSDIDMQMKSIEALVRARLCHLVGELVVPKELEYIVAEVSIARFNQVGSEGLSSHTVEGETQSWADDLFEPYMADITEYKRRHGGLARIRFL